MQHNRSFNNRPSFRGDGGPRRGGGNGGGFNQKPVPVKEGEEYEVTIEGIGEKGDGIAKIEGFVIVVPNTQKGQKVRVKVNAVRGKVSFAEVVKNLGEASADESSKDEADESSDEDDEDSELDEEVEVADEGEEDK